MGELMMNASDEAVEGGVRVDESGEGNDQVGPPVVEGVPGVFP